MKISQIHFLTCILLLSTLFGCQEQKDFQHLENDSSFLHNWNRKLTEAIVKDAFTPPVGARIYAYPNIAAYEALAFKNPDFKSMAGQLNGLEALPQPESGKEYCFQLVAIKAFIDISRDMVYSDMVFDEQEKADMMTFQDALSADVYDRSIELAAAITKHIKDWAAQDFYKETRAMTQYIYEDPKEFPGAWQMTPPGYLDPVEPNWSKIRPFVIESPEKFPAPTPTQFDSLPESKFYKEALEVYDAVNSLTNDQKEIAEFWDCNPNIVISTGHIMYFKKKLSPGGHWMSITSIVCKQENTNPVQSAEAYSRVAISLMDAFIACWDTKYKTNLIRPETFINLYIDRDWKPILETPPFPEYTSGHSVISSSAAMALNALFGEVSYVDTSEEEFGLPTRSFNSFIQACEEAAVSRLYGGIHYMPAIDNGIIQGKAIGQHIVSNLKTR